MFHDLRLVFLLNILLGAKQFALVDFKSGTVKSFLHDIGAGWFLQVSRTFVKTIRTLKPVEKHEFSEVTHSSETIRNKCQYFLWRPLKWPNIDKAKAPLWFLAITRYHGVGEVPGLVGTIQQAFRSSLNPPGPWKMPTTYDFLCFPMFSCEFFGFPLFFCDFPSAGPAR